MQLEFSLTFQNELQVNVARLVLHAPAAPNCILCSTEMQYIRATEDLPTSCGVLLLFVTSNDICVHNYLP